LWGAPFTGYLTLAFLLFVLVTMGFSETGRWVLLSLVVLIPLLIAGWFAARPTIMAAASQREGITGIAPVLAPRPRVPGERRARRNGRGDPRP
jgi:L-asparagine permease